MIKKINFWLWAGWVASYLQRSLSAQVNGGSSCHPWQLKTAIFMRSGPHEATLVMDRVRGECVLWELGWFPMKLWTAARRIGFYWHMRSVDDHRCSKNIFIDRQGVGWAAKVRRIMERKGLAREGSGVDNQEVLKTIRGVAMREWVNEMSRRVQNRGDGHMSLRRVYRWRDSWGQGRIARATGYERLWVKVRLGDWECNLREWRMGKGVHRCWGCGVWGRICGPRPPYA